MDENGSKRMMTDRHAADWYGRCIDEPLRDIVRLLRDNGVNTECSCAHENPMWIQCHYIPGSEDVYNIHQLLWSYFSEHHLPVTFTIKVTHEVKDGYTTLGSLEIRIPRKSVSEDLEFFVQRRKYYMDQVYHLDDTIKSIKKC